MTKTRSMTRNQNRDADASSRKSNTAPWSDLNHHLLFLVMMKLGVIEFLSFGGVCKSWRSLALKNKKIYMSSRPPMFMTISDRPYKKECYLEDFEGRKFKTFLPHSGGRTYIGSACGYLMLFGWKTRDVWVVNPITRHELHFPCFPFNASADLPRVRSILVFSPLVSGWAFVILHRFTNQIWFSIAGTQAWNRVVTTSPVHDLHAFKGKIYTIDIRGHVYEMRLNPDPKLTFLKIKNFPNPGFVYPEFVILDEKLHVMDHMSEDSYEVHELDLDEMKWVLSEETTTTGEFAFFVNDFKYSAAIKKELWVDHRSQYNTYANFLADKKQEGGSLASHIWYFPNDCFNVNLLDE